MNFYKRHLGDYARDTGHLSLLEHGVYTLLLDRYYASEKPLPADVRECCKLARATTKAERDAVAYVLGEFFELRATGHHNNRADDEIAEAQDSQDDADERRIHERERKRRYRARRRELFEQLRELGIVPPFDTPMDDLEGMLSHGTSAGQGRGQAQGRPGNGTANQTPDSRLQTKAPPARTPPTPAPEASPTDAGRACLLMRQAGCPSTNPSHPDLIAALAEGVTPEVLADTAREAVDLGKPKPFPWAIATARGRQREGANPVPTGPPRSDANPQPSRRVAAIQTLLQGTSDAREPELAERRDQARLEPAVVPVPRLGSGG